jgi:hypothetical protein
MSVQNAEMRTGLDQIPAMQFEGEIREFVRRDVMPLRRAQSEPNDPETAATQINALVQRVAGSSLEEIDRLIEELRSLRSLLESEGERVQRELASYARLSQATISSTKVISDNLKSWRDKKPTLD